jgi:hypothetical protein
MEFLKRKAVIDKKTKQTVAVLESDDLAAYIDAELFSIEEIDDNGLPFFFKEEIMQTDDRIRVYESQIIQNYCKEITDKYNMVQLIEIFLELINANNNLTKTEKLHILEKHIQLSKKKMSNKINTAKKITTKFKFVSLEEEKEAALKLDSIINS